MVLMMVAVRVMMIMMMMLLGSWRGHKIKKRLLLKMTQIDHRGDCDALSGHDAMMIGLEAFHWWGWLGYWGHQAFHLAFIWQLSRINGGPNFYDSTLARPKVSITSEAETQGDKEHSSQHLQAGQCGSFCQCPVFARIYFLWQYFSVNDPVFANKTCQLCQLCQLRQLCQFCHLQLKGLSPVCLRLCLVSSSERANLAKQQDQ